MARPTKPWLWVARGGWFVKHGGRTVQLVKGPKAATRDEALVAFHRLKGGLDPASGGGAPPSGPTVGDLIDLFLEHCERRIDPTGAARDGLERRTFEWYVAETREFRARYGALPAHALRPYHVTQWVAAHPEWSPGTHRAKVTVVKRLTRWAWAEGYFAEDPLGRLRRPGPRSTPSSRRSPTGRFATCSSRSGRPGRVPARSTTSRRR
ncbi:MAG TPA: hypothetical protein VG406_06450 [Isosphaeraceae bacterium]|jgi:hypothetical protein|nr:hypothetical protein [Isosphaeraceae bacterium]